MMSWNDPDTSAGAELKFGNRIAQLVAAVSDDPSITEYEERKRELRDRVERSRPETLAIYAADKIAKVRELGLLSTWRASHRQLRAKLALSVTEALTGQIFLVTVVSVLVANLHRRRSES